MINTSKEKLLNFYSGNIRYHVPFFQRSYVWDIENWETLWDNVYQVFTDYRNQKPSSEHFIGTLITKQRAAERIGENSYDVIDGQQRLTTIALILKAIADTCNGTLPKLKEKTNDLLLFEDSKGNQYIRVESRKKNRDIADSGAAAERHYTMLAFRFTSYNKQSMRRTQSRPWPAAHSRFDASVGVHSQLEQQKSFLKLFVNQFSQRET